MAPATPPAPGRRLATAVAVFCLLVAAVSAPAGGAGAAAAPGGVDATDAASPAPSDETAESAASLSVDVAREGDLVRFRAVVDADDAARTVRLDGALDLFTVTDTDGFRAVDDGYRLREGREQGTLVAVVDLGEPRTTRLGAIGPNGAFQAGENWAFAPSPRFRLSWDADGDAVERRLGPGAAEAEVNASVAAGADDPLVVGDRFVFLSAHEVHETGETRLIVPEAAGFEAGADRALSLAERSYREVGSRPDSPVTAFVLPRSVRGGGAASGTDLWLRADATELTVAHEFAHAATTMRTTEATQWLGEATAEYAAYRVTGPTDTVSVLTARVTQPDAVLGDRDTWHGDRVAYRKGAAVIALLDERVREVTDGEASVRSVLAALSAAGRVDAAALREAVVAAADTSTAAWFDGVVGDTASFDRADGEATGTPGIDQRLPEGDTDTSPATALSGLLAALAAVAVVLWVLARLCYGAVSRLRRDSAV